MWHQVNCWFSSAVIKCTRSVLITVLTIISPLQTNSVFFNLNWAWVVPMQHLAFPRFKIAFSNIHPNQCEIPHFTIALLQGQSDPISLFLNKNWFKNLSALLATENIGHREVQPYATEQINKVQHYHNFQKNQPDSWYILPLQQLKPKYITQKQSKH